MSSQMDSKEDICLLALNQVKLDSDPGCKILERSAGSRSAGHVGSPQRETSRLIPRHRRKGAWERKSGIPGRPGKSTC